MPRIITQDRYPHDFCSQCYPFSELLLDPENDYDCEHPSYGDEVIACEKCGKELNENDDFE